MKSTREEVYQAIAAERAYQNYRWPGHTHDVGEWVSYISAYVQIGTERDARTAGPNGALNNLRKTAALGFACMEQIGAVRRGGVFLQGPLLLNEVSTIINDERAYQDRAIKERSFSTSHFLNTLRVYSMEADKAWTFTGDTAALDVIRQLTAVAVRAMETCGVRTRDEEEADKPVPAELVSIGTSDVLSEEAVRAIIREELAAINGPVQVQGGLVITGRPDPPPAPDPKSIEE